MKTQEDFRNALLRTFAVVLDKDVQLKDEFAMAPMVESHLNAMFLGYRLGHIEAGARRQYFYKDNRCKAKSAKDSDCICWHDEGTEPFPSADSTFQWREAPEQADGGAVLWVSQTSFDWLKEGAGLGHILAFARPFDSGEHVPLYAAQPPKSLEVSEDMVERGAALSTTGRKDDPRYREKN